MFLLRSRPVYKTARRFNPIKRAARLDLSRRVYRRSRNLLRTSKKLRSITSRRIRLQKFFSRRASRRVSRAYSAKSLKRVFNRHF